MTRGRMASHANNRCRYRAQSTDLLPNLKTCGIPRESPRSSIISSSSGRSGISLRLVLRTRLLVVRWWEVIFMLLGDCSKKWTEVQIRPVARVLLSPLVSLRSFCRRRPWMRQITAWSLSLSLNPSAAPASSLPPFRSSSLPFFLPAVLP